MWPISFRMTEVISLLISQELRMGVVLNLSGVSFTVLKLGGGVPAAALKGDSC